mmetsp:Transcript_108521/g.350366  ORF Transcript_108521/g.350366 Transcript_108521/m.350366 type:complete len:624 (+) Transcript_108521:483-2354(+)
MPRVVAAVGERALGPGVLADARRADAGLRAGVLCPPGVGLWCEAEHVRHPELLLALRAPALLPGEVAALGRDVGVVLRADGPVLPAVPLAGPRPGRGAGVRHEHALAHDALHDAPGEEHGPADQHHDDHRARVEPGSHVHARHGVLAHGPLALDVPGPLRRVRLLRLPLQLLLGLGWRNEVGAVLESGRKPGRQLAGGALVEEPAARLLGPGGRVAVGGLGHDVEPEGPEDLHHDDHHAGDPGDVDDGLRGVARVLQRQRGGRHEGPRGLHGQAAAVVGQHVEAEHEPDGGREPGGADVGAPDHAELGDVVEHQPEGEGLDQVHHAEEEAHAAVRLGAPVLLLRLAQELEVLQRLGRAILPVGAGRGLGVGLPALHLLLQPGRRALRGARQPSARCRLRLRALGRLHLALALRLRLCLRRGPRRAALRVGLLGLAAGRLGARAHGVGVPVRVRRVRHDEGQLEHVVGGILLPRGEELSRAVQLPLRRHGDPDDARPELHGRDLRADGGVEDEPRRQGHEAEAHAQALQVHARDEDRGAWELQAGAPLDEDGDAVAQAHREDRRVDLHLGLRHRGEVGAVLAEQVDLLYGHLAANGEARPSLRLVELVVGAIVGPPKDSCILHL